MGSTQLEGMMEMVDEDTSLRWHLECNHFPSMLWLLDAAKEAIECCRCDEWDTRIEIKPDVYVEAGKLVDGLHLEFYLDTEDEYGE